MMDAISLTTTRSLIEDGLARFLNDQHMNMIDGGTTSGAMLLIGVARHRRSYTFPLIGVAPDQKCRLSRSRTGDQSCRS